MKANILFSASIVSGILLIYVLFNPPGIHCYGWFHNYSFFLRDPLVFFLENIAPLLILTAFVFLPVLLYRLGVVYARGKKYKKIFKYTAFFVVIVHLFMIAGFVFASGPSPRYAVKITLNNLRVDAELYYDQTNSYKNYFDEIPEGSALERLYDIPKYSGKYVCVDTDKLLGDVVIRSENDKYMIAVEYYSTVTRYHMNRYIYCVSSDGYARELESFPSGYSCSQ